MWLSNYTTNGYKKKQNCALKWEQGDKTQLRAKLLQTLKVSGVLLEAGPK